MKDALALGKLVSPIESKQVVKDEEIRREIPNNNPFKWRKLELATSEEGESCAEIVSVLMVNFEGSTCCARMTTTNRGSNRSHTQRTIK